MSRVRRSSRAWQSPQRRNDGEELSALFAMMPLAAASYRCSGLILVFRRFGIAENQLALLFFAVHVLNALSHLGRLAGAAHRAGQDDGLHTSAVEPVSDCRGLYARGTLGGSAVLAPRIAWWRWMYRPGILRRGRRATGRAHVCFRCYKPYSKLIMGCSISGGWGVHAARRFALHYCSAGAEIIYDALLWRAFAHVRPPRSKILKQPTQISKAVKVLPRSAY